MEGIHLGVGWEGGAQDTAGDSEGGLRGTAWAENGAGKGEPVTLPYRLGALYTEGRTPRCVSLYLHSGFQKLNLLANI